MKPIFGESGVIRFARDFPNDITLEPPPCTWFMRKIQKPKSKTNGSSDVRIDHQGDPPVPFESNCTPCVDISVWRLAADWSPG